MSNLNSIDGVDLKDKHVVLREKALSPEWRSITWRVVKATGGFGCSPKAAGSTVFVTFVRDDEQARFSRGDVERLATDAEVAAALALKEAGRE